MIGVGIPCILVGTADMIYTKGHHGGTHFATWHGVSISSSLFSFCLIHPLLDIWYTSNSLPHHTGIGWGRERLVRGYRVRWRDESKGCVEVPQVISLTMACSGIAYCAFSECLGILCSPLLYSQPVWLAIGPPGSLGIVPAGFGS